ncbi:hypothetical protein LEP1GSC005_2207 [Leptospira santarosai str. ST188]|uniref:hypothetical protein n=1 Tax=Leptospira santarosai TaxID=28183 RepID=UPI0002BC6F60|nr:hypothetical protein [Leptospira santarosai]EMF91790.1 hypothetical protein LEP1GSC005_2207 [Leptospira santarosai str. ST188]
MQQTRAHTGIRLNYKCFTPGQLGKLKTYGVSQQNLRIIGTLRKLNRLAIKIRVIRKTITSGILILPKKINPDDH